MLVFANVLQPLIDFFEAILVFFHDNVGLGWGMAIVALTIVVRAALLPLTLKQFKSMQRLAQFATEIKKLQEKYKGDKDRLNQEMMRFYRENKVNPFSSCLPMIAQLPVFLSLFYMLQADLRRDICPGINRQARRTRGSCGEGGPAEFLVIPDLTNKATGTVLVALIVLYVGSQLLSTILMSTTTDRTRSYIMYALPFVCRGVHLELPGRPARLLDHDEPLAIVSRLSCASGSGRCARRTRRARAPWPKARAPTRPAGAGRPEACQPRSGAAARASRRPPPRKKRKRSETA
jgi:YidC/Oxa1 family membrane protein insertase